VASRYAASQPEGSSIASSNWRAVSTSPAISPALLAPRLCTYRIAPLVTMISRPRSPARITSSAVITFVMLPIGRARA
jgi:hypothetical protein